MLKRPRRLLFLGTIGVTLLMAVIGVFQARVRSVGCRVGGQDCPTEVVASLSSLHGSSLVFTDVHAASRHTLETHTAYRVVSMSKEFPSNLTIVLEPQTLQYQFKLLQQDHYLSVTDQAKLLSTPANNQLAQFVLEPQVWAAWQTAGRVPAEADVQFKETSRVLGEAGLSPHAIVVLDEQTMVLYLPEQQTAIVDMAEFESDVSRLATVLRQIQGQELPQPIVEIDLRFNLPVLRFARTITRHESL